jgi:hypothetical protein
MTDDLWFERLVEAADDMPQERASAKLKSRIYSALVERMAVSGALLDLAETKKTGGHLCVFENALTLMPVGREIRSMNPCRVCHARVLGERMDRAPIFWPGCPYSEFHNG